MTADEEQAMSDRVALDGVRRLIEGRLTGAPIPGTLADRVEAWALHEMSGSA